MKATDIKKYDIDRMAVVGTFIANQLGGWDTALAVLVGFMAADFLTGSILALFSISPKRPTLANTSSSMDTRAS